MNHHQPARVFPHTFRACQNIRQFHQATNLTRNSWLIVDGDPMVSTIEGGIYKFSVDKDIYLGGGFNKYFLFSPLLGEDFQF